MKDFKAKLTDIKELTGDVRMFFFEPDCDFQFKAGQFVMIKIEDGVSRAYSIASRPDEKSFCLAIKLIEGGRGSEFLRGLSVGSVLNIKGPFGHFVVDPESQKDLVLVATGTGLAPMRSIVSDLIDTGRKMTLIFGVRHVEDIFLKDEFEKLDSEHENFNFKLTLSKPDESWTGLKGRVTDYLEGFDPGNIQIYICGSKLMVSEVREYFLSAGVPESDIKNEVFG